jgi:hypothetical protein
MKKLLIAAAALLTVATPIAASADPMGFGHGGRPVEAVRVHDGYRGGYRGGYGANWDGRYSDGRGAAVAAGMFGLILGAALANNQPYYAQQCGWETQAYPGPYGGVRYEQVQVCR